MYHIKACNLLFFLYITLLFTSIVNLSFSQSEDHWSHWTIVDKLVETWSLGISTSPNGEVWVIHSEDGNVSVIDGYSVNHAKIPIAINKIEFSSSGYMWALSPSHLYYKIEEEWQSFEIPFETDDSLQFKPVSDEEVIILYDNTLYFFNRNDVSILPIQTAQITGLQSFTGITASLDNQFWVTGSNGIATFQFTTHSIQNWKEYSADSLEFSNFQSPWVNSENELYVIAQSKTEKVHLVYIFKNEEWVKKYTSNSLNLVSCWEGQNQISWVLNRNNTLIKLQGESQDTFSQFGQILDITIQPDGIFWLATSKGVFRYTPPVWSTPFDLQDIQHSANAIIQDHAGRLWFDCTRFLLKLENGEWKRYPYPNDKQSSFYETGTLCILPNQTIAIRMLNAENSLTVFNPDREEFEALENPDGLLFGAMTAMSDGTIWFQLGQNFGNLNTMSYRIESYDGKEFTTVFDNTNQWGIAYPRSILKNIDGGFWIGGTSGLGQYHNGQYELIHDKDLIDDDAAFALTRFQDNEILAGGRNSVRSFDGEQWTLLLSDTDQIRSFYSSKDGTVWVCTAAGLIRYYQNSWIKMNEKDGLPSSVVNEVFSDSQNNLWAATSNGIALYQPEFDISPPTAFIDPYKNSNRFAPNSPVHIKMEGTDMWKSTQESNLYYSYRINQQEWSSYSSDPIASLEQLEPGIYQFDFRVMDSNFNTSNVSEPFEFNVLLNWNEEPYVRGLLTVAIVITLFFMIYAIKHQIHLHFMNNQLKAANEELERISCIDGLTGIANRRCFDEHLNTEWRRGLRTNSPIAVIICDVDFFKLYNDHFGHLAGDDCLRVVAKTLSSTVIRAGDIVARYGGEEFVIVLVNTSLEGAQQITKLIHEKIEALCLKHPKSKCSQFVSISSGITSAIPQKNFTEKILLAAADKALYISKNKGRNCSHTIENPYNDTWSNGNH